MVNPSTRITSSIVHLQPLYGVGKAQRILADQGMTMMVVTHEMAFAREVADRVIFIDQGHIVEQGPAREVLGAPQHERTQDFLRRVTHPI
jgi:polar amino acid transport system ATP-binding protein